MARREYASCQAPGCLNPLPAGRWIYCSQRCGTRTGNANARARKRARQPPIGIPEDILQEIILVRRKERLSFQQLSRRYPYSVGLIAQKVKANGKHQKFYQRCVWCRAFFTSRRPDAKVCSKVCAGRRYRFLRDLGTMTRHPEYLARRRCAWCEGPIPVKKRSDARCCKPACASAQRRWLINRQQGRRIHPTRLSRKGIHATQGLHHQDQPPPEPGRDPGHAGRRGRQPPAD